MDPLTIASMFLFGGGAGANSMAANQVEEERKRLMEAERLRQQKLDREAHALNVQSRERYQNFGGQQKDTAKSLGDYFVQPDAASAGAPPQQSMPPSASNITVSEENKQTGAAKDFTNKQGAALGDLRSFGELFGGIQRGQARDAGEVGQINGFKTGSSSILPFELDNANHAGDMWKFFGDLAQGAGSLAMTAGLSGGGGIPGLPKPAAAGAPVSLAPPGVSYSAPSLVPPPKAPLSLNPYPNPYSLAQSYFR